MHEVIGMKSFSSLLIQKGVILLELSLEHCELLWSDSKDIVYLILITKDGHLSVSAKGRNNPFLDDLELKKIVNIIYEKSTPMKISKGIAANHIHSDSKETFFDESYTASYNRLKLRIKESPSLFGNSIKVVNINHAK